MNVNLTRDAENALIDVGTNRQGATINSTVDSVTVRELQDAGLIGDGYGLTRRGTIVRQRLVDAVLDALF